MVSQKDEEVGDTNHLLVPMTEMEDDNEFTYREEAVKRTSQGEREIGPVNVIETLYKRSDIITRIIGRKVDPFIIRTSGLVRYRDGIIKRHNSSLLRYPSLREYCTS